MHLTRENFSYSRTFLFAVLFLGLSACNDKLDSDPSARAVAAQEKLSTVTVYRSEQDLNNSVTIKLPQRGQQSIITLENDDSVITTGADIQRFDREGFAFLVLPLMSIKELITEYGGHVYSNLKFLSCVADECIRYEVPFVYQAVENYDLFSSGSEQYVLKLAFVDGFNTTPNLRIHSDAISLTKFNNVSTTINLATNQFSVQTENLGSYIDLVPSQEWRDRVCLNGNSIVELDVESCDNTCHVFNFSAQLSCIKPEVATLSQQNINLAMGKADQVLVSLDIVIDDENAFVDQILLQDNTALSAAEKSVASINGQTKITTSSVIERRMLDASLVVFQENITVNWCSALMIDCATYVAPFHITIDSNRTPSAIFDISEFNGLRGNAVFFDGQKSSDPENDDLQYNWHVISQPINSNVEFNQKEGGVVSSFVPTHSGVYKVGLTVNDGKLTSEIFHREINIVNNPPAFLNAAMEPEVVYTDTDINIVASYEDVDSNDITVGYEWFINDVKLANESSASLDSENFAKHDHVRGVVTISDGLDTSTRMFETTVENSLPEIQVDMPAAILTKTTGSYLMSVVDADGDSVDVTIKYGPAGMRVKSYTNSTYHIELSGLSEVIFAQELNVNYAFEYSDGDATLVDKRTLKLVQDEKSQLRMITGEWTSTENSKLISWIDGKPAMLQFSKSNYSHTSDSFVRVLRLDEVSGVFNIIWELPWPSPDLKNVTYIDLVKLPFEAVPSLLLSTAHDIYKLNIVTGKYTKLIDMALHIIDKNIVGWNVIDIDSDGVEELIVILSGPEVSSSTGLSPIIYLLIVDLESKQVVNEINTACHNTNVCFQLDLTFEPQDTFAIGNFKGDGKLEIVTAEGKIFILNDQIEFETEELDILNFSHIVGVSSKNSEGHHGLLFSSQKDGSISQVDFDSNSIITYPNNFDVSSVNVRTDDIDTDFFGINRVIESNGIIKSTEVFRFHNRSLEPEIKVWPMNRGDIHVLFNPMIFDDASILLSVRHPFLESVRSFYTWPYSSLSQSSPVYLTELLVKHADGYYLDDYTSTHISAAPGYRFRSISKIDSLTTSINTQKYTVAYDSGLRSFGLNSVGVENDSEVHQTSDLFVGDWQFNYYQMSENLIACEHFHRGGHCKYVGEFLTRGNEVLTGPYISPLNSQRYSVADNFIGLAVQSLGQIEFADPLKINRFDEDLTAFMTFSDGVISVKNFIEHEASELSTYDLKSITDSDRLFFSTFYRNDELSDLFVLRKPDPKDENDQGSFIKLNVNKYDYSIDFVSEIELDTENVRRVLKHDSNKPSNVLFVYTHESSANSSKFSEFALIDIENGALIWKSPKIRGVPVGDKLNVKKNWHCGASDLYSFSTDEVFYYLACEDPIEVPYDRRVIR